MQQTCRVCNSSNLTLILSLGNLYLSDFTVDNIKPASYPLNLVICPVCHLVQLRETTPATLLYTEHYGYKSGINQTMRDELKSIVHKSLKKIKTNQTDFIAVDIGANDGTLLSFYPQTITKVAVEPVKKLATESKNHADVVINDFFHVQSYKKKMGNKKAKIVTAISCFYDMEEPNTFVEDVANIMDKDGMFVIQQNYLAKMLELNAFDNIVHEHLEYYTLLSLQNLLDRHNLEVFDVELTDINGGSFRTYISFKGSRSVTKNVSDLQLYEKKLKLHTLQPYKNFASRISKNKKILYNFISAQVKNGKKVYLYGASTRGNTLLQYYDLNNKLISCAVERNPEKWGKKIASVGIPIISEEQARREKPDFMLVLPWFFKEEFLIREKKYLDNGGQFIFPLPQFEVISAGK